MNRVIKIFVPLLVVFSLFSCLEENDDPDYENKWLEINRLDQSCYYELGVPEESSFDGALYHDGVYIEYKTDTVNNVYVYFVSKKKINEREGVFVVLNLDGTLFAFGKPYRMVYACGNEDGSLSLLGMNGNDNNLKLYTVGAASKLLERQSSYKAVRTSQGYDPKSWIKVGLGNVPYLGNIIGLYDLGDAWNDHDSFQMASNLFTTGISYIAPEVSLPVSMLANEWDQQCQELLWRLYGNAGVKIEEVIPVGNNKFEVVVNIGEAQDLAKPYTANIEDNFGCRVVSVPREVYLAVCGSTVEYGDIDLAYSISDDVLIENEDGDNEIKATVTINIPKGKLLYLRPYLISYMRVSSASPAFTYLVKLFKKQYLYGPDYPYVNGGVDLSWKVNYLKGRSSNYENEAPKRTIEAQIEVCASRPPAESSDVAVVDWGYVLINKDGNIFDRFSFFENNDNEPIYATEVSKTVNYTFEEDELVVDDGNYTASLEGYLICPYMKFVNTNNWIPIQEDIYGEPEDFGFRYSSSPSYTFVDIEYYGSYVRDLPPWDPVLINSEEKIYADAQSEYCTNAEVKGAFFMKKANYREYGTNKYCSLFRDITKNSFEDGPDYNNVSFLWNRGDFSNMNKINYHIEYTTWDGSTGRSNTVYLNPVRHVTDKGEVYYFGFSPSL